MGILAYLRERRKTELSDQLDTINAYLEDEVVPELKDYIETQTVAAIEERLGKVMSQMTQFMHGSGEHMRMEIDLIGVVTSQVWGLVSVLQKYIPVIS